MTNDRQILVDILDAWVLKDINMLRRKINKAEFESQLGETHWAKHIKDLIKVKYLPDEFKKLARELVDKYMGNCSSVSSKRGICGVCGEERAIKDGKCSTCRHSKKVIKCGFCGEVGYHAGYGLCRSCYHREIRMKKKGAKK